MGLLPVAAWADDPPPTGAAPEEAEPARLQAGDSHLLIGSGYPDLAALGVDIFVAERLSLGAGFLLISLPDDAYAVLPSLRGWISWSPLGDATHRGRAELGGGFGAGGQECQESNPPRCTMADAWIVELALGYELIEAGWTLQIEGLLQAGFWTLENPYGSDVEMLDVDGNQPDDFTLFPGGRVEFGFRL
jgi:hypothetical protein